MIITIILFSTSIPLMLFLQPWQSYFNTISSLDRRGSFCNLFVIQPWGSHWFSCCNPFELTTTRYCKTISVNQRELSCDVPGEVTRMGSEDIEFTCKPKEEGGWEDAHVDHKVTLLFP